MGLSSSGTGSVVVTCLRCRVMTKGDGVDLPAERISCIHTHSWRHALFCAFQPLERDGFITRAYRDFVISTIEDGTGLYMDLGHGMMLAHARAEKGARRTGAALTILCKPIFLADLASHPIRQIWAMAATDPDEHQKMMSDIAKILINRTLSQALSAAQTVDEIHAILNGENDQFLAQ